MLLAVEMILWALSAIFLLAALLFGNSLGSVILAAMFGIPAFVLDIVRVRRLGCPHCGHRSSRLRRFPVCQKCGRETGLLSRSR